MYHNTEQVPGWSCSADVSSSQHIYAGLQVNLSASPHLKLLVPCNVLHELICLHTSEWHGFGF